MHQEHAQEAMHLFHSTRRYLELTYALATGLSLLEQCVVCYSVLHSAALSCIASNTFYVGIYISNCFEYQHAVIMTETLFTCIAGVTPTFNWDI